MARARNIKPGFFTNADLIECEPLARLLFAGLWCEADRRGILEDRPKTLKIKILPGDNCDVGELLTDLERTGFIQRYEVNGQRCILILNFEKHQHPHQNEQPNNLPAPEQHQTSTVQAPEQSGVNVNLLPITDPLLPHTENGLLIAENGSRASALVEKKADAPNYSNEFLTFWNQYPNGHGSKKVAFEVWQRLRPDDELQLDIMASLAKWNASEQWQQGYIKDAERFLRNRMWEVDPPPPKPLAPARNKAQEQVDMLKRIAMEAQS
jgi:hypothetical protein